MEGGDVTLPGEERISCDSRARIRRAPVVALLVAIALAVPATVLANRIFSDVPTSSTFHNTISQVTTEQFRRSRRRGGSLA